MPDTSWSLLGVTPLDSFRVPIGIFRWKFEKEGYDTLLQRPQHGMSGVTLI